MTPEERATEILEVIDAAHRDYPAVVRMNYGASIRHIAAAIRAALRERDAEHEIALKKARADALREAAARVRMTYWKLIPPVAESAPIFDFAQAAEGAIRALLEEAGK